MIEFKNVSKTYNNTDKIINNFSLDISKGEFIVLLGPSGCGKSTTLRMLAGLETITEGDILINDKVQNDIPPKDRNIAVVFQNYALYPHMTVAKNIGFGLKMQGVKKDIIKEKVERVSKLLNLEDQLNKYPKNLSGGQMQRVALGRAIVRNPDIFLMDEPLSNLDAKLRSTMREEIVSLHKQLHTTTVYVTHDQSEAMTMADRIVILNKGDIQQLGTPIEIYNRPKNLFVAGFIGYPTMNLIKLNNNNGKYHIDNIPISIENGIGELYLGIRPEHVKIDLESPIKMKIKFIENMGNEKHIHCQLNGDKFIIRDISEYPVNVGDIVGVKFNKEKALFYDMESTNIMENIVWI